MKVLFKGNPNEFIKDKYTNKIMFKFDENGEFVTEDLYIISRARNFFDSLEIKEEIKNENNNVEVEDTNKEVKEEKKEFICKYCNEKFEKKGLLLAHYKKCDKKEAK